MARMHRLAEEMGLDLMAHGTYSPVGYAYNAAQYCLDCIPKVVAGKSYGRYLQDDGCNCTECLLDRIGDDRGIIRYDESSYDSSNFPKAISYFNDLHSECGLDEFSDEPRWVCHDRCERCGDVIDPVSRCIGTHSYVDICPGEDNWLDTEDM